MKAIDPKLHPLLIRQLKRSNIDIDQYKQSSSHAWQDFLLRVSRTYFDHEQEHYLIERSMEVSSKEMMDLNEKLNSAQEIAHLGYWSYDRLEKTLAWSKETFFLMGFDPFEKEPSVNEIFELIHKDDQHQLKKCIKYAFIENKYFEIEYQFKNKKTGNYYWHYIKGHPYSKQYTSKPPQYISGIIMDITDRKQAEEKIKKIHQQLLSISRQAGMAEVATSVLHNIGNILNSANVSVSLLLEILSVSHIRKLIPLCQLIKNRLVPSKNEAKDNKDNPLISDYLIALSHSLVNEYTNIDKELNNINTHLGHIKDIVQLQKNISDVSDVSGVKETILLQDLVDLAIQMSDSANETDHIDIIKNVYYKKPISIEKSKLLQILVNLFRNAKEALTAHKTNTDKKIFIDIKKSAKKSCVAIVIKDNGIGIEKENLIRIFSLGFTTKPNGHGFGMHSSALTAAELGGSLNVKSEGLKQGATFTIELPLITEPGKDSFQLLDENEHI